MKVFDRREARRRPQPKVRETSLTFGRGALLSILRRSVPIPFPITLEF